MTELVKTQQMNESMLERVLIHGDLSKLNPTERMTYYRNVTESLGLNPLTKPFDYITLNGKLVLYAKRDCTDQLRKIHGISIRILSREQVGDCLIVTAQATSADGRTDESTGVVPTSNLKSTDLANAMMKAETKAKRRVTLSIVGLGMFDESELDGLVDGQGELIQGQAPSEQAVDDTPVLPNYFGIHSGKAITDETIPYAVLHDCAQGLQRKLKANGLPEHIRQEDERFMHALSLELDRRTVSTPTSHEHAKTEAQPESQPIHQEDWTPGILVAFKPKGGNRKAHVLEFSVDGQEKPLKLTAFHLSDHDKAVAENCIECLVYFHYEANGDFKNLKALMTEEEYDEAGQDEVEYAQT